MSDGAPAGAAGPQRTLEISGLTKRVSPENVREIFGRYGAVARLSQPRGPDNRPTGTTYAVFETAEAAEAAQRGMHGGLVDGQTVSVVLSARDVPARLGGRRSRGGRGRGRRSRSRERVVRRGRSPHGGRGDRARVDHYAGSGSAGGRHRRSRSPPRYRREHDRGGRDYDRPSREYDRGGRDGDRAGRDSERTSRVDSYRPGGRRSRSRSYSRSRSPAPRRRHSPPSRRRSPSPY